VRRATCSRCTATSTRKAASNTFAKSSKTFRVDRIDHGTNIVESAALVAEVKRRGIGLTCCPIFNRFITNDMKAVEIAAAVTRRRACHREL
jgi:adenosine deaminase